MPSNRFKLASGYTLDEAQAILAESRRITDEIARKQKTTRVNFRAHSSTATPPTPTKRFLDFVEDELAGGQTLPESIRAAAIAHPELHAKYLNEKRQQQRSAEDRSRETAARFRNRNS